MTDKAVTLERYADGAIFILSSPPVGEVVEFSEELAKEETRLLRFNGGEFVILAANTQQAFRVDGYRRTSFTAEPRGVWHTRRSW
jgi:hypothetical protein